MNLATIIAELRAKTTLFGVSPVVPRIAGAAEFEILKEAANMTVPAAYVIPLDDTAEPNASETGIHQDVRDGFGVVVVLSNTSDERGQASSASVHGARAQLWVALLGLVIAGDHGDYGPIEYDGGSLLHLDRKRLYYQFEFSAVYHVDHEDTRQGADLAAAPALTKVHIDLDAIEPMALPTPGPDDRIEHVIEVDPPQ